MASGPPDFRCYRDRSSEPSLQASPFVQTAQTIRAVLFANATMTSMRGILASIGSNDGPHGEPRLLPGSTSTLLPMIYNLCIICSLIFEIVPQLSLPPFGCCLEVSPSHAGKIAAPAKALCRWGRR